jgi:hypothetical protein
MLSSNLVSELISDIGKPSSEALVTLETPDKEIKSDLELEALQEEIRCLFHQHFMCAFF